MVSLRWPETSAAVPVAADVGRGRIDAGPAVGPDEQEVLDASMSVG